MPVIAKEQSDGSNLPVYCAKYEIAASTLKINYFSMSPRNDDIKIKYEVVVK